MPIFFQSLRSSSAGNCLALWTPTSSILVDCGVKVQRECRQLLEAHARVAGGVDAVIVSHAHGDHMAYGALRVLGKERIPVHAERRVIGQLGERHDSEGWEARPEMRAFQDGTLLAGDFRVAPFEVPHAPGIWTFGFAITVRAGRSRRRIVVCTDFHDYGAALARFADADFIFLEANHDRALLAAHPNPSSRFHLHNGKSASLLHHAVRRSTAPPRAVMLGHLSEERNRRRLAIGEVERVFDRHGTRIRFHLDAAPAHRPSEIIEI